MSSHGWRRLFSRASRAPRPALAVREPWTVVRSRLGVGRAERHNKAIEQTPANVCERGLYSLHTIHRKCPLREGVCSARRSSWPPLYSQMSKDSVRQ